MPIQADSELEKCEVTALLASGIFSRAPNLVHILTYICSKHFEGAPGDIKEYNIAVEALGRPADFDQKRDSIVRVEAHRLRKRLREFYERDGADHPVQIEIPPGQYAPRFVFKDATPPVVPIPPKQLAQIPTSEVETAAIESREVEIIAPRNEAPLAPAKEPVVFRSRKWMLAAAVLAVGGIVAVLAVPAAFNRRATEPSHSVAKKEPLVAATGDEIRILAGVLNPKSSYVDASNHVWSGDRFFSGGTVFQSADVHPITGTRDSHIYQSRREGTFSYDIPLAPGVYELRLYFGETLYGDNNIAGGGETSRIFQVSANGKSLLKDFDVIVDLGPSAADVKVFKDISPASDGRLHLKFDPGTNPAFVNGIEIVPGIAGKMRPIRMVARDRSVADKLGRSWDSDRFVRGGILVGRNQPVLGTADAELFRGERFGNLTYTLPVAQPGRYAVKLYFVERWFGSGGPGGGGEGSRIFDILCNGVALKRSFDIYKEAGGPNRAVVLTVHDLEPTPQGKLVISMVPERNYASVNALEVEDESK